MRVPALSLPSALLVGLVLSSGLFGCEKEKSEGKQAKPEQAPAPSASAAAEESVEVDRARLALFGKLPKRFDPAGTTYTDEQIGLGRQLYYDARLSKGQDVSCNSCHDLATYGVDGKKVSNGHKGQTGQRNSPTVYDSAGQFVQFWDGRAANIEAQVSGPCTNPVEMAMTEAKIVSVLKSIPGYAAAFKKAFPDSKDPVSFLNVSTAIGAFERGLSTPGKWDKYLAGDDDALTNDEKRGLVLFMDTGCITCHSGPLLGGTTYQKLGAVEPWPNQADLGRYQATKQDADKMMFKAPLLRNVDKTAPYFHDGSTSSLTEVVTMMGRYQLGKKLSDKDAATIVTFLKALTGDIPKTYVAKPELPPSGPSTPKPDRS
jgi:cytochrome c peroxidase